MSDRKPSELAEFLSARRAQLTPQDAGLDEQAARRRVPGLRREELARLAGVSVDYYTRLEQGRSRSASTDVLDALAAALQL
ncbi:MAG TPA: helix-turn-helix transcriptional regulator, partial [Mycobacterium sp.]